ncbi:MAG: signal peptide peptidase SppA [Treponema sp.]|jgi:protease-4|nr:signal peptide peptidase SppA [Treponema sp.]
MSNKTSVFPGAYLEVCLGKRTAIPVKLLKPRPVSGSFLEIVKLIEKARKDTRVRGLVLNLSGFSADRASLWELRKLLESFKTPAFQPGLDQDALDQKGQDAAKPRKKIVAYLGQGDLDLYCLASVADKIVLDATGTLGLFGFLYGRGFVRRTLEKIGIGIRELRYLTYKSAQESFTRDSLSEADKEQYGAYLDDTFAVTRALLMESRSLSGEDVERIMNDEFLYSAARAHTRGLVDYTGREEAVQEAVRELEGGDPKTWFRWGDAQFSLLPDGKTGRGGKEQEQGLEPRPYRAESGGFPVKRDEIALVYARGQTDFDQGMAARGLAPLIREISRRKAVKALVLRVESPGGSAEAADHIARAVGDAKQRIPVVVSMGSVAASGGYWVSMNASSIVASPYTLTGSIGVIGAWFFDRGLYDKLGFAVDTISRGAHADLAAGIMIPHRDLSAEEEEQFRRLILDLYADFVAKVAAGRNLSPEAVEAAAQGRVYSGLGARDAGLVDRIGGIAEALQTARELAKIPPDKRIRYNEYPKAKLIDRLSARFGLPAPPFVLAPSISAPQPPWPDFLLAPAGLAEDLRYRLSRNGTPMPILPLGLFP